MRILKRTQNLKLPEKDVNKFFVQAWYSLVHQKSLDSHRVRCMNSLNIVRELQGLISRRGALKGIEKDIDLVSQEALDIIKSDLVMNQFFQEHVQRVIPLLRKKQEKKDKQKKNQKTDSPLLVYYLKDLREDLEKNYKDRLFAELEAAIFEGQDKDKIFHLTRILMSLLVDNGHSMESLFSLVKQVLCKSGNGDFNDRFNQLKSILSKGYVDYEIIFRLTDFSKYNDTMAELGGIKFSLASEIEPCDNRIKKFMTPGQNVVFANLETSGLDAQSAGLKAKQKIDNLLDLIRFELEGNVVTVDGRFVVGKQNKEIKNTLYNLPSRIPNPSRNLSDDEFLVFLNNIEYALEGADIQPESRKKITSAFRFYRMGRDTPLYENKFINWWTALEYLLRTGEDGSIITEIEAKLTSALLIEYTGKHLKSYISACVYCGADIGGPWISPAEFFELIHDKDRWKNIKAQIIEYPLLVTSLEMFRGQTKDEKSISKFLETHENHLRWHINRLWRMRCDIVHSAEYSINLTLLSANLEYYLKTLLDMVLKSLRKNPCIESLGELFIRIDHTAFHLKNDLKEDKINSFKELLKEIKL
jgi:hypothetical protein